MYIYIRCRSDWTLVVWKLEIGFLWRQVWHMCGDFSDCLECVAFKNNVLIAALLSKLCSVKVQY